MINTAFEQNNQHNLFLISSAFLLLINETISLFRSTLQHRCASENSQSRHHPLRADPIQRLVQLSSGRQAKEETVKTKKRMIHFDNENKKG